MDIRVKICGISSEAILEHAIGLGADYVGFVFFARSPRAVSPERAGELARTAGVRARKVGVFVDPDDSFLEQVLHHAPLDILQLHGSETPARVAEIRRRFGVDVMRAIKVSDGADLKSADDYLGVADRLMFDAKAPASLVGAMPGGNRVSFDWTLLAGRRWSLPWMLSGGLDPDNVAEALRISGASEVDVSSGVEEGPGRKDPRLIAAFIAAAKGTSVDSLRTRRAS